MGNKLIDRNYILDSGDNYLKILGNMHDDKSVVSYIKYYPNKYGNRYIGNTRYGYNTFVNKSFAILLDDPSRIKFSQYHGEVVTCTPYNKIKKIYDCREKVSQIIEERDKYKKHKVGSELIKILERSKHDIDFNMIGITGSFLIDAYNENSDIDLVCYGFEGFEMMQPIFKKYVIPYTGENGISLYNRRMVHMPYTQYEVLIKQENRKLQGLTKEKGIHINCQPLWKDGIDPLCDSEIYTIGEISCTLEIEDDTNSIFSPCIYKVKVDSIVEAELNGVKENFKKDINYLISFIGAYASTFKKGELVYVEGMLVIIKSKDGSYSFGIELSPWNTSRRFKAVLL